MKSIFKQAIVVFTSIIAINSSAQNKNTSVLASGDIFKIAIPQSGIYKIDYNFLKDIEGFNVDNINPKQIHIYGNEGGPVNQVLADSRTDDLADNNIFIQGEEDGSFDSNDFILFYAEGNDKYDLSNGDIEFKKNPYENNNFYFIKVESNDGPRIPTNQSLNSAEFTSSNSESVIRHEIDRLNLLGNYGSTQGTGKNWYGESFANETVQNFSNNFNFKNIVSGSEAQLKVVFAGRNKSSISYKVTVDGQSTTRTITGVNTGEVESRYARLSSINESVTLSGNTPNVEVELIPNGSQSEGWLDYIEIIAKCQNIYSNEPLILVNRESTDYSTYGFQIETQDDITIWNISTSDKVSEVNYTSSGSQKTLAYETNGELQGFVVFEKNQSFPAPEFVEQVVNQNLHQIERADFIIIYHPDFLEAAEKLALHRTDHDDFAVVLVNIYDIYNEFSSGKLDPSGIRDFVNMVHSRDPNFKYLLLFGDGSYDFRGINQELEFQNFIPTYETNESLHPVSGFPTDDFYGLLSSDEGSDNLFGTLEIGIGRIPCRSNDQAIDVVNKIIHYDTSPNTLGDWRTRIGFTADDEDTNTHIRQADGIAERTEQNHPQLLQQKVYFDAFNQESTPGGSRYPDAQATINSNIFNGQLVLNYLGHGGPKGWAQERVLQVGDILNWKNYDKLPVLITATCTFTGFDEPSLVSAGEHAILNGSGGAIALFTTVRAVFANDNELLTREVFDRIFLRNSGKGMRMGDVLREAQNDITDSSLSPNTRKFLLMGDPSMQLALPQNNVVVKSIDGIPVENMTEDTISALERVTITGEVTNLNNALISDFNGTISLSVYDKESNLKTLDNDQLGREFSFDVRKNLLYKGSATITNGTFSIDMILPKDIDFEFGKGLLSFYASDGISRDGAGYFDDIIIGGTSNISFTDEEGPEIDIYLDDRSFEFGGQTSADPILLLDLADETGINLSSTSIGHDITAQLDDQNSQSLVLNNFYQPVIDKIGEGTVEYQLDKLEPGIHQIYIKAWDILNNSSEKMSEFVVAENLEGFIRNVFNYPNPFSTSTNFTFEHDLANSNVDVLIDIYTVSGRLIKTIQETKFSAPYRIGDIPWNGTDDFGSKLAKGVYLYKIKIESNELNLSRESEFQKLVILN